MKNRKGDPQDFISHLSIHPNVIVRMSAQPPMESLESLMRLSCSFVTLHYDTVFNLGDFYLSTLLFRHSVFKDQPVVSFAFSSIPDTSLMTMLHLWRLYVSLFLA